MAVKTNAVAVAVVEEASLGVLPGSPVWRFFEPNDISTFGATFNKVARDPISPLRTPRKGTITDIDSAAEFATDLTIGMFKQFAQGYLFSTFTTGVPGFEPTAVTATHYTVPSGGALAQDTLIFARGFANPANNGLKVVGIGSTGTNIVTSGLVVEASPPTDATVEVVGFRTATGDLDVDGNGNLTSTALDFTTLGLTVGQGIYIGGELAANQFVNAANRGLARVRAIAANLLTIDKRQQAFVTEANTTQDVDIYFGPFLRNVRIGDPDFAERSFQFEATYVGLDDGSPQYEYSIGNVPNLMALAKELADKATATIGFVGQDTEAPTTTRKSGTFRDEILTEALNTSNDFLRIRIQQADETGITSFIKSSTLNIDNQVTAEKVIGQQAAPFMNFGNFVVTGEMQALFTSGAVLAAIRANDTVGMDFALFNDDGGLYFDIPSMTLGAGDKEFPRNETVLININGEAFTDEFFGHALGITHFPFLPPNANV